MTQALPQPEMYTQTGQEGWRWNSLGWARMLLQALGQKSEGLPTLPRYVVAQLPSPKASKNVMVIVTDESGGEVPAWSDGTDWRRVTDRAIVT